MKILYSSDGLILEPETTEESFEMGSLWGRRNSLPSAMSAILWLKGDGPSLLINPAYIESLKRQLNIVDEILGWAGSDECRADKIQRLMKQKRTVMTEYIVKVVDECLDDDGEETSRTYRINSDTADDARVLAFVLDGGLGFLDDTRGHDIDEGILSLAKAYTDVSEPSE